MTQQKLFNEKWMHFTLLYIRLVFFKVKISKRSFYLQIRDIFCMSIYTIALMHIYGIAIFAFFLKTVTIPLIFIL